MNLSVVLQVLSTLSILLGITFGILNLRNFQAARKREAAILMLNSFQTNDFVRGLLLIFELPNGISKAGIDKLPRDDFLAMYVVVGTWERLGILVFRREIPLDLVDDAYSGPIVQSWETLGKYILEFRKHIQRETAFEWFQWLAETMTRREEKSSPVPAYLAHKNWKQ